jgi:hypothetical protein
MDDEHPTFGAGTWRFAPCMNIVLCWSILLSTAHATVKHNPVCCTVGCIYRLFTVLYLRVYRVYRRVDARSVQFGEHNNQQSWM